jgi:two-component system phosphate regulon sensor histidine kinase PhoR
MSRTILILLTVFLSLAMIALVGLQAYWFKNSLEAKEQQLGLVVNQVLSEISQEIIRDETVLTILEEIRPPVVNHKSTTVWNFHMDARSVQGHSEVSSEMHEEEVVAEVDDLGKLEGIEEITIRGEVNLHQGHAEIMVESGQPEIRKVTPSGGEEVILYTQPDPSITNQRFRIIDDSVLVVLGEDETLRDTILITSLSTAHVRSTLEKNMEDQEAFVTNIVRQMITTRESIEDRLTAEHVEKLLAMHLLEKGVDMPFEYAVYEEGKKPIYHSANFNEYEDSRYFRAPLLPGGVFRNSTLISIYFPGERKYILGSVGLMGGTSALITLFIVTLFSLALFVMFKQRRLANMKNDFVNNMTHELKTPISTISLASQMLNDKSIPDEQKNLTQISRIIQTESRQLGFQVERVLQMAIFDHGQLKLKLEEVDVHDLIETVAQNFLLQLDKRGGTLDFLPEASDAVVLGDSMHITNVISNLIENAMKYTKQAPEVILSTRNDKGTLVFSVKDNGIGISKEDQKRIFDKFFRVPTGNIHNVKGFGLGLSYVKLIVEQHHGSIRVKSDAGFGSQFDIVLPLYKDTQPN